MSKKEKITVVPSKVKDPNDVATWSVSQLKAQIYDQLIIRETASKNIALLEQQLLKKAQDGSKAVTTQTASGAV